MFGTWTEPFVDSEVHSTSIKIQSASPWRNHITLKKPHQLEETISNSSNLHYKGGDQKSIQKMGVITKPYYSRVISPQGKPICKAIYSDFKHTYNW